MIYSTTENLIIRDLEPGDIPELVAGERAQGWDATPDKYEMRLRDQAAGKSISMVAVYEGHTAGYINVYPNSTWGALGNQGYPEIVDFGVLEKVRRRGIGTCLMDCAEKIAFTYADTIYLGVGLHSGYGSAQRMYVSAATSPTAAVCGGKTSLANLTRPAAMMTTWFSILPRPGRERGVAGVMVHSKERPFALLNSNLPLIKWNTSMYDVKEGFVLHITS